ncbi:MAG: hypothetical protein ACRC6I_17835, partial [Paracoccaceae bacterium]
MTLAILGYFAIALGLLVALTRMILVIGRATECQPSATAIATGYLAIGLGGVTLIAALIPVFATPYSDGFPEIVTLMAMGLASLSLGLGFTHAVRTLERVAR